MSLNHSNPNMPRASIAKPGGTVPILPQSKQSAQQLQLALGAVLWLAFLATLLA
ncbi:MAG: hypothetical protein QF724_08765 [Planctomycetota bacterium]|jgi:hypothetical protein|nr:hypothetical protein [Planctomycetota bacterium]MDP6955518.1 hypothetical protein [Planctomycetota bacterium]